ncbi:MAG: hypothetical protein Q8M02_04500 [Candidatus Didemnitutus sp.]|nr:hypothetical protein [Candidatus Didemnitutus sp.]
MGSLKATGRWYYLADVHLTTRSGETLFLNNALLREGHATPMGAEAMEEWTP